jgi:dienelactone hydrolase
MKRKYSTFFALLVFAGCGRQDRQAIDTSRSLAEARRDFRTKLVRKEATGQPLPTPPSKLFRTVHFDSAVGTLAGYLTPDPKDGKKSPAIIWITGGDCNTIDEGVWADSPPSNDQTARAFREAGIVMMFPTLRGGSDNPGFHEGFFGEVDDILSAADYLAKQPFVDPKRIYLGGHSSGGTMVLLVAECSDRFRAVFSFGPADDIRGYPPEFHVFDISNPREFDLRAPARWLHSIRSPVFVFGGKTDDAPALDAMARVSTNPSVRFFVVRGADHFNILAPTNRLIAQKILRDSGEACNIDFTMEQLTRPFGR